MMTARDIMADQPPVLFCASKDDPWARTAVRSGSIEDVVAVERRRRPRNVKSPRIDTNQAAPPAASNPASEPQQVVTDQNTSANEKTDKA
jgi:hypothetical protein